MADEPILSDAAGGEPPAASAFNWGGGPTKDPFERVDPPVWAVTLWPHRSLSRRGFRWLMALSAAAFALPLLALSATPAALALAPYAGIALLALWGFMKLSYRSGRVTEELRLWPDAIAVERREPWGRVRRWAANPYWVDIDLTETRNVEHYLTLRGAGRRIELGAFLTPEERMELATELRARIAGLHRAV
ncbi:DUF2244 domain-containing protein [Pikeienuella piscinae]|uniref:DUF2244 domain-containing protein n=1 Tax=Pikeienuella piscinae TaxID=2748098 RepID=A0A7L5BYF3_9RHOB|nr:DUF2244 domain-containing protein [Pikeienuella piscinae]QIE55547.1 DUF2244 domain-containing protein [Pikeienuella piscinae]